MTQISKMTIIGIGLAGAMLLSATPLVAATALTTELVATVSGPPVLVTAPPGDTSRIFIVEQTGGIRIVKNGTLLGAHFLNIAGKISTGGERGLLGLAFHPNYDSTGYFYINYTDINGDTKIERYTVSGNPDLADSESGTTILQIGQPFSNHNGGMIVFGPADGYLYIGTGDGGAGGDPGNNSQNPLSLLGKMLRIDIDGASPYAIPPSNPFVGDATTLDEIWDIGLRNPWRFSFDQVTADIYIGDVGQNLYEEIDFESAASGGGINFGWRLKEAAHCFNPAVNCDPDSITTDPIVEYVHDMINFRCSVTGGYVYRGCAIPDLQGTYFYADFCTGEIFSFIFDGDSISDSTDRTAELDPPGADEINLISSFGIDAQGEIYICDFADNQIFKIIPDGVSSQCNITGCCDTPGDADNGGEANIGDATYIVKYIFQSGLAPPCIDEADANGNNSLDIGDATYIVKFIFQSGADLICGTTGS